MFGVHHQTSCLVPRRDLGELTIDESNQLATELLSASKNPLLHIRDLYDAALCLRVLWILHHSHVQFLLAFAECDVCCAITRGDLKYVQKLAVRRYFQNLTAEPLGNIDVTLFIRLLSVRIGRSDCRSRRPWGYCLLR